MNMFEKIGTYEPDNLISGNKKGVLTRGITLAGGQGVLKRGTLLARDENDLGVMFGEEKVDETNESAAETATVDVMLPSGILTDDADTGDETSANQVVAMEYITGTFNPDAIIVKEGTEVSKYTETLRSLGIFLEEVM